MKLLVFIFALITLNCQAQLVLEEASVFPQVFGSQSEVICSNENFVVYKIPSYVTEIGINTLDFNSENDFSLVVLNEELELVYDFHILTGNFLSATYNLNGDLIVSGQSTFDGEIYLDNTYSIDFGTFLFSINEDGQLNWLVDGLNPLGNSWHQLSTDPSDNSIYWSSTLYNYPEWPPFEFGGDSLQSLGNDGQWNMNTILLKFSEDGQEQWGQIINGTGYNLPEDLTVGDNGLVSLSVTHKEGQLSFSDSDPSEEVSLILTYEPTGESYSDFYSSEPPNTTYAPNPFIDIQTLDNTIIGLCHIKTDSILFGGQYYSQDCSPNDGQSIIQINQEGEEIAFTKIGCRSGGDVAQETLLKDGNSFWLAFVFSTNFEIENYSFETAPGDRALALVQFNSAFELIQHKIIRSPGDDILSFGLAKTESYIFLELKFNGVLEYDGQESGDGTQNQTTILKLGAYDSVSDLSPGLEINIFPNPVSDLIKIERSKNIMGELKIILFDNAGKQVITEYMHNNVLRTELDLSSISSGTYMLKISNETTNNVKTYKIFK